MAKTRKETSTVRCEESREIWTWVKGHAKGASLDFCVKGFSIDIQVGTCAYVSEVSFKCKKHEMFGMKQVSACAEESWKKICSRVNRGVVFIDNACAECLHWNGGLVTLVNAGAVDVKEFSSFECASESQKKAVFVVSSLLFDVTADIICDVIQSSHFQYVVVATSISAHAHMFTKTGAMEGDEKAVFEQFEDKLLEWMGNMNYTAEVIHMPVFGASISPGLFVTPAFTQLFPLLDPDVKRIELQYNAKKATKAERVSFTSLEDIDANNIPKDLKIHYKCLASCMNDLLGQLEVREEIYSVGHTSRMLALELENFPSARSRRKTNQNTASVVFIDRSLDLASPCDHQGETLLDRMLHLLPRLPGHNNDVLINMTDVCSVNVNENSQVLVPGCLSQPPNSTGRALLNTLVSAKQKEALMDVNRHLVEAASKEKLPLKLTGKPGRVTADQLDNTITLFKGNNSAIDSHRGLLQVAMATSQVLKHGDSGRYDNQAGVEKMLVQSLSDDNGPSALHQVTQLLEREMDKPENKRTHSLDDILVLLTYVYSLSGDVCASSYEEEKSAQSAFVEAILAEKDSLPELTKNIVGDTVSRSVVMAIVEDIWYKLESLGSVRSHFKQFGHILDTGSVVSPASHKPLLRQLVELIFDPDKPDISDIEYKSSGFKDLLKTGFGFFMNVSKPRPSDHPLLILFVIGGVTGTEVKQLKDAVASFKSNIRVIIGSTQLLKPTDILKKVFCQDNVNPAGPS